MMRSDFKIGDFYNVLGLGSNNSILYKGFLNLLASVIDLIDRSMVFQ